MHGGDSATIAIRYPCLVASVAQEGLVRVRDARAPAAGT